MNIQNDMVCFTAGGRNTLAGAPKGCEMIELSQQGRDNFTVRYGLQVKTRLTYAQAAAELGACIMHWSACNGDLDNRKKGERLA